MTSRAFAKPRNIADVGGQDVATAKDGVAALLQIERMPPDLIVSDLNMPRMSGFEFLPVVRLRFPQIAIVAMSGEYRGDDVPLGVVADRFFAKGQQDAQYLLTAEIDPRLRGIDRAAIENHLRRLRL